MGPTYQLHYQIVGANIVQLANVGMVHRGDEPRFPLETVTEPSAAYFNCDFAIEACVRSPVDFAHASGSDERFDPIRTQRLARLE